MSMDFSGIWKCFGRYSLKAAKKLTRGKAYENFVLWSRNAVNCTRSYEL